MAPGRFLGIAGVGLSWGLARACATSDHMLQRFFRHSAVLAAPSSNPDLTSGVSDA